MKKIYFLYLLVLIFVGKIGYSQRNVAPNHYCVYFTDKKETPFDISKPNEFLSQKAIDRRKKYNIKITNQDLPVNLRYVTQLENFGFEIINVSKWLNCAIVFTEDSSLINKLSNLSFVKTENTKTIKEKKKFQQRELKVINVEVQKEKLKKVYKYGKGKNQIKMLNGHLLHNRGYDGKGMTIAVIDNGFYKVDSFPVFKSLWSNNQILGWRDFVEKDTTFFDAGTHGMMVLSIIAANLPRKFVGTAPKANFWLLRSENLKSEYVIEEYNWVCAVEFADSAGVDIIHSSLGYSDFDDDDQDYKYEDMDGNTAISTIGSDIAASRGILLTTSAGNSGASSWKYITAPADADSCLTVGACWKRGKYAWFSSQGPTYDNRIKPNISAKGVFTTVQNRKGKYGKSFGTSLSGPVIAGLVACLWQAYPNLSNMEIIDAVQKTASQYSTPDGELGYGIPDFNKAFLYLKNKNE